MKLQDGLQKQLDQLRKRYSLGASIAWAMAAVLSAAFIAFIFWAYIPLNMDEFVSYQTLACLTHPYAVENVFCSPCSSYYLRVLNRFVLPLLTYDYIGSLTSLLYAPFYFIWPSPLSGRMTGVITLLIQALVIAKMFRFRTAMVFCCLLLFLPYSFVHIADTGPVAFQTTSVFIICYFLRRWLVEPRWQQRALLMSAAGLTFALGCWVKPTYFFVSINLGVISLAAFLLAMRHRSGERMVRTAEYVLFFLCAAVPALLVYEARHLDGSEYLPVLNANFVPGQIAIAGIAQRFSENVLHFLINPLDATFPCFAMQIKTPFVSAASCLAAGVLILSGIFLGGIRWRYRWEILLNYCLASLTLVLVATNVYAKSMHHAVLAYPFMMLAVARSIQARPGAFLPRAALVLFLLLNASLFFKFPQMWETARSQGNFKAYVAELNDDLNAHYASDSVIVCVDWGIYFIKSLYGPRSQVVLSLCALKEGQLQQAADIARRLHRNLTIVGMRDNQLARKLIVSHFPGGSELAAPGDKSPWRIWRISLAGLETPDLPVPAAGLP